MAWEVGVISVGPPLGVDPVGTMRLRISNKQTKTKNVGVDIRIFVNFTTSLPVSIQANKCI